MSVDILFSMISRMDTEPDQEVTAALESHALSYLRSGGVLSLTEWFSLSQASRDAFEKAGAQVWSERAAAIACYLADPAEAVRVIKGDDAVVEAALKAVGDPK